MRSNRNVLFKVDAVDRGDTVDRAVLEGAGAEAIGVLVEQASACHPDVVLRHLPDGDEGNNFVPFEAKRLDAICDERRERLAELLAGAAVVDLLGELTLEHLVDDVRDRLGLKKAIWLRLECVFDGRVRSLGCRLLGCSQRASECTRQSQTDSLGAST